MNKVDEWLKTNMLTLNYKKNNYMIIGSNHSETNKLKREINHNTISQTKKVKYIGVFFNNQLSWQPHIDQKSKDFPAPEAGFLNLDIMFLFPT